MSRLLRGPTVDVAVDHQSSLGEGPVWIAQTAELVWVDIDQGELHFFCPSSGRHDTVWLRRTVTSVAPRASGGLVLTVRDGFAFLEEGQVRLIASVEASDARTRMNDGSCDRAGRYWAGTMCSEQGSQCALYRLGRDLEVARVRSGVSISNGIAWSPDDATMYYVDSGRRSVDSFDFDLESGRMSGRRVSVDIDPSSGKPDGIAVDAEGGIWVALWGGAAVHRYTPTGRLDLRVELPVANVTSCCLGGDDLSTLFVTTSRRGVGPADRLAGSVFACRPGVPGLPANSFTA